MTWTIYALIDPRDRQVRYVGKTSQTLAVRLQQHLRERKDSRKARWIKTLTAAGVSPEIAALEVGEGDWAAAEIRWIAAHQSEALTNTAPGGVGVTTMAEETREKLRAAAVARHADPEFRRRFQIALKSPERLAALSAAGKGKKKSAEHIAKLPQNQPRPRAPKVPKPPQPGWAKGRKLTPEHKEAIGNGVRGITRSPETREKMRLAAFRRWAGKKAEEDGSHQARPVRSDQHAPDAAGAAS